MTKKTPIPLFGILVKKRLIELSMTQRELAHEIGVNENYLTDILNGRKAGTKYKDAINRRLGIGEEKKRPTRMKEVV